MKELLTTLSNTTDNNYLTIKLLNDVTTHVCLSNILLIKANGHYLTFTCPDSGFTSNTYSLSSIAIGVLVYAKMLIIIHIPKNLMVEYSKM